MKDEIARPDAATVATEAHCNNSRSNVRTHLFCDCIRETVQID